MRPLYRQKLRLARLLDVIGLSRALLGLQSVLRRPYVRCVNYHDVPASRAAAFEEQLRFFRDRFAPVGERDLLDLLAGEWRHSRPGLLISFDDGVRSHFEVAAPLLEKYGFVGWFFVPAAFPDTPVDEQAAFVRRNRILLDGPPGPGRAAMTWEEIRQLDRKHVVGCHTMNHRRLDSSLGAEELEVEIPRAKRQLEEQLGHDVDSFCWVGGEEWSYSGAAAESVRRAGFRLGFMTNNAPVRPGCDPLQIQRTNLEARFPLSLVAFQLSGALDLIYLPKRRRVVRKTSEPALDAASGR